MQQHLHFLHHNGKVGIGNITHNDGNIPADSGTKKAGQSVCNVSHLFGLLPDYLFGFLRYIGFVRQCSGNRICGKSCSGGNILQCHASAFFSLCHPSARTAGSVRLLSCRRRAVFFTKRMVPSILLHKPPVRAPPFSQLFFIITQNPDMSIPHFLLLSFDLQSFIVVIIYIIWHIFCIFLFIL